MNIKYINNPSFTNKMVLVLGIISAITGYTYAQVNFVPVAPIFGILAIAFGMVSKNLGSTLKKRIIGIILAWTGIIISLVTYMLIIYYYNFIRNNIEPLPELTLLMKLLGVLK